VEPLRLGLSPALRSALPRHHVDSSKGGALRSNEEERMMEVKEELLTLAYKKLDEAVKLLKAAGEALLEKRRRHWP
jgi:hypothetical protein